MSPSFGRPSAAEVPGASPESAVSVRLLTTSAKEVIEGGIPPLWVRGEVSGFKAHRNGHWYFALRDAEAQVNCVVWSAMTRRIPAPPDDGMAVTALGQLTVWPVRGDLQFSVRQLEAAGDGLWRKALERTRANLERDGLLDPARKRRLPPHPRRIAVITSPDGAALHDIITVARHRSPEVELVIVPARVQGEGAVESLVAALDQVGRWRDADLVIIGRGGGSREDLWAFNEEPVARALAACPLPTISAVGHEVDVSICDLVADCRAATPSAAAELAVPSRREVIGQVAGLAKRLAGAAVRREERSRVALKQGSTRLASAASRLVERRQARLAGVAGALQALSPLAILERGFAVARTPAGASLSSRHQYTAGLPFDLWLRDGVVQAVAGAARPLPEGFGTPGSTEDS